jgi:hypothetical protein
MAVSESTVQTALQTALRAMSDFADTDVTINDWGVLDGSNANAPYAVIENSDDFESRQDTQTATNNWNIPVNIFVRLAADTWATALNSFRDTRQNVLDAANTGTVRSASGQAGIDIKTITPEGKIGYIYDAAADPEYATPQFIVQRMIFHCEEF